MKNWEKISVSSSNICLMRRLSLFQLTKQRHKLRLDVKQLASQNTRITVLNDVIMDVLSIQHTDRQRKTPQIFYATQVATKPPTNCHLVNEELILLLRFLENQSKAEGT